MGNNEWHLGKRRMKKKKEREKWNIRRKVRREKEKSTLGVGEERRRKVSVGKKI